MVAAFSRSLFASVLFCRMCFVSGNSTLVLSPFNRLVFLNQNEDAGRSPQLPEITPMKHPRRIHSIVLAAKSYRARTYVDALRTSIRRSRLKSSSFRPQNPITLVPASRDAHLSDPSSR